MKFKDRFQFWMPTKGKADFMFVQHLISTLKSTGRMAVIMPHGVLFRGGEERKMREWMIRRGYLEAVIGLPPALFYGNRHSRLHSHYQPSRSRYPQGGTLYQCRPRIQGGQGAEHPALRRYREDSLCLPEQGYLSSSLENLREKYHQPLHSILKERDAASVELAGYLMELGYE